MITLYVTGLIFYIGLPWRVMNLDANLEDSIDSNVLLDVLKVLNYVSKCIIYFS